VGTENPLFESTITNGNPNTHIKEE